MRPSNVAPTAYRRIVFPLVALLLLCACSGGGGGAVDDDDDGDITGPDIPGDPEGGEYAAMALGADLDGVFGNLLMPGGPMGCVTTDGPWIDSDQDGVPDDLTLSFSLEGCRFTLDGGSWGSTSGAVRVVDPGAPWGLVATLDALGSWNHEAQEDPPLTISREHTGTTRLTGSPMQVAFSIDHDVLLKVTGQPDATLTETWTGNWTPAASDPFTYTLASGTMTVGGTTTFTRNGATIRLSLETVTPLRWDASCTALWPQEGTIRAHVTSGGPAGYLELVWTGCWNMAQVDFVAS